MSASRSGQARVLVVDDDATVRLLARAALERHGLAVSEAANGDDALCLARRERPDLILLDVEMPQMDGFAACSAIRGTSGLSDIPVIMLTGRDDDESIQSAYDSGATDFIAKPIRWPVLAHRVRYVLRSSQQGKVLAASRQRNQALVRAIPDSMIVLDAKGTILTTHRGSDGSSIVDTKLVEGASIFSVLPKGMADDWKRRIAAVTTSGSITQFETEYRAGKQTLFLDVRMVPLTDDEVMVIFRDVSVQKRADAKVRRLAFFDTLTGLPNRQSFLIRLSELIREYEGTDHRFSILYIDLDKFKRINDSLGHTTGDALLRKIAERLEGCVRKQDHVSRSAGAPSRFQVARLGGDEFTILLRDVDAADDAVAVSDRIARALRQPLLFDGHEFVITPSIGIATYPDDGTDIESLVANADMAMYQSKAAGRDRATQFSGTMSVRSLERLELEDALRRAVREDQFELHYQPKLCLRTNRVSSAEALLRWTHPERGPISPAKFIPIAEESGLIAEIGHWVLHAACEQLALWREGSLPDFSLAINLSGKQFESGTLRSEIVDALKIRKLDPGSLELELTESTLMKNSEQAVAVISGLQDMGVSFAIDDFGTGYSSLSYLTRFPISTLKIDRSFVASINGPGKNASICSAIVAMAHSLGLKVIAEGVETGEQLRFVARLGCDEMQGFFFARPMPSQALGEFIAARANGDLEVTALPVIDSAS